MRYPLITIIIAVLWIIMVIIANYAFEIAQSLFYMAMVSTVIIFYIGFQMRTK
ncbi:MAG: hypothetical protein WC080_02060 [Patescibacteria group bacterium]|jgi:uncharacterized RDD family membrane protein YckC